MAKKKPKAQKPKPDESDAMGPTPERLARYADDTDKFKTDTGRIIRRLNPVDTLYSNDEISADGYIAYQTYIRDWYAAGFAMKGGIDLSAVRVDGGGSADSFTANRIDAANRFSRASIAIGRTYTKALSYMVLDDMSMTAYARDILGKTGKSAAEHGRKMLIRAINCLANHYGPSTAPSKPRAHSSMANGARPQIHPFQKDEAA